MKFNEDGLKFTGSKWCGQRIYIKSTGDDMLDNALKSTFHDQFHKTAPLEMRRADVQFVTAFARGDFKPLQGSLFDVQG